MVIIVYLPASTYKEKAKEQSCTKELDGHGPLPANELNNYQCDDDTWRGRRRRRGRLGVGGKRRRLRTVPGNSAAAVHTISM